MSAWRPTPSPLAILGGWPAWREPLSARSGTSLCHPSSPGAAGNRGSASPGGRLFSGATYFILAACIFMADKIDKIFPIIRHDTSLPCCRWDDCVIGNATVFGIRGQPENNRFWSQAKLLSAIPDFERGSSFLQFRNYKTIWQQRAGSMVPRVRLTG